MIMRKHAGSHRVCRGDFHNFKALGTQLLAPHSFGFRCYRDLPCHHFWPSLRSSTHDEPGPCLVCQEPAEHRIPAQGQHLNSALGRAALELSRIMARNPKADPKAWHDRRRLSKGNSLNWAQTRQYVRATRASNKSATMPEQFVAHGTTRQSLLP